MTLGSTLGINIQDIVADVSKKMFNEVVGGVSILKGNDIIILMHPYVREDGNSIATMYFDRELNGTKLFIYNSLYKTTEVMKLDKKTIARWFSVSLQKILTYSGSYLCVEDIDISHKVVKKSLSI